MSNLSKFSGLSEVADDYAAFLIDSWGVMHDGLAPFEAALKCLGELKSRDKRVFILTNSARRSDIVAEELFKLGIDRNLVDHVVSGGEAAWQSLQEPRDEIHKALGSNCFYLGNERSRCLMDGLSLNEVGAVEDSDFVLNTGIPEGVSDDETSQNLETALRKQLTMICANPDIHYYVGDEKKFCAGEISRRYEAIGGQVIYHGKPHRLWTPFRLIKF